MSLNECFPPNIDINPSSPASSTHSPLDITADINSPFFPHPAIAYGGRFVIAGRGRFAIASASSPVHSIQQLSCHSASPKAGKNPFNLRLDNWQNFTVVSFIPISRTALWIGVN
jgi:hypothetical protein